MPCFTSLSADDGWPEVTFGQFVALLTRMCDLEEGRYAIEVLSTCWSQPSDFAGRIAARVQAARKAIIGAQLTLSQASKAWVRASRLACAFAL
jgi:hypothetical protein